MVMMSREDQQRRRGSDTSQASSQVSTVASEAPSVEPPAGGKTAAEKRMCKAFTEYIRSPQQVIQAKLEQKGFGRGPGQGAKDFYQKQEVQRLVDLFRRRVEDALDQDFDDWTVKESYGDCVRTIAAKVHVGDDDYVHILAKRNAKKNERWVCRYAPYQTEDEPLTQSEEDYEQLPESVFHRVGCEGGLMGNIGCAEGFDSGRCTVM